MHQNPSAIKGFYSVGGRYQFLSNFYQRKFTLEPQAADSPVVHLAGMSANSVEHFFQAAKTLHQHVAQNVLQAATSSESKALGRQLRLRPDWEIVKYRAMKEILRSKFSDPDLREWLMETGSAELVEANNWHDTVWGVCNCSRHHAEGQNRLGLALMELRAEIAASRA